ncbi:MAG TPA: TIGR01777 family oxidoreductase [Candidatus Baltobacteraceae bacterium]|jgi:hypothetical protein|nr:TIGR01777 family oxidoreductase [Candidatus Baltobacteraceae bacterium]
MILGASGFIGGRLASALRARGDDVLTATLREPKAAAAFAASCDAIVNLAGEPVAQRWNDAVKRRIKESRVDLPRRFIEALAQQPKRPSTYVTASAIGYYGTSESATFVEESPSGDDFLARVCAEWEREAQRAADLGMRVACVRTGVVLGTGGGALPKMLVPFRAGLGGKIGSGRQWFSWIHAGDITGIYLMAIDKASGPLNATAPNPVTNAEFTKTLAAELHRPAFLPVPTVALRAILGEGAGALLQGQRVLPERTRALGYAFEFSRLSEALADLLQRRAR